MLTPEDPYDYEMGFDELDIYFDDELLTPLKHNAIL